MTESDKLRKRNVAAIKKMQQDQKNLAELQEAVRQGKLTAAEALRSLCDMNKEINQ